MNHSDIPIPIHDHKRPIAAVIASGRVGAASPLARVAAKQSRKNGLLRRLSGQWRCGRVSAPRNDAGGGARLRVRQRIDITDARGVALIEFAIVFPVFFLLLFGGIEMTRLLLIQQRIERAGYVLADITTQYLPATSAGAVGEITQAELVDNVFPQFARVMEPYQDRTRQATILTSLRKEGDEARVLWQIASRADTLTGCDAATPPTCVKSLVNGLSPGAITPAVKGQTASLPADISAVVATMPDQASMIVVETFYYYQPILDILLGQVGRAGGAGVMGFRFALIPRIYAKRMFFSPRNGAMLYLPPSFPVP